MPHDPGAVATWANAVTVARVMVSPVLFALITGTEGSWVALALWVVLCASDAVDGYLARRYGSTRSGAFLDPLADKVLVLGAMFTLVGRGVFPVLPVAIIAVREWLWEIWSGGEPRWLLICGVTGNGKTHLARRAAAFLRQYGPRCYNVYRKQVDPQFSNAEMIYSYRQEGSIFVKWDQDLLKPAKAQNFYPLRRAEDDWVKVIDELGQDLQVEEVAEALAGQIVLDIRHPDAAEDEPLQLDGVEVQAMPFYALNNKFKELDENRQYLLYCDRGVMSRLHAHHLLSEGHANVRVYRPA